MFEFTFDANITDTVQKYYPGLNGAILSSDVPPIHR